MPERSSERKARRDPPTSSLVEPEPASLRTENVDSIPDKDFSKNSGKVEKSVSRRIRETDTNQRESLKMIENRIFQNRHAIWQSTWDYGFGDE